MALQTAIVPLLLAALFGIVSCSRPAPAPQPSDPSIAVAPPAKAHPNQHTAPANTKPWSELIVGRWKRDNKVSEPASNTQVIMEFSSTGRWVSTSNDRRGERVLNRGYRLDSNTIVITDSPPSDTRPDPYADIEELTLTIDFETTDRLIMTATTHTRMSRKGAEEIAFGEPIEPFLARVRVHHQRSAYDRMNTK